MLSFSVDAGCTQASHETELYIYIYINLFFGQCSKFSYIEKKMLLFSADAGCTQGAHETVCFSKKLALFLKNICFQGTREIQRFVKYRALCSKDRSLFGKV